jgi:tripartite-type tricarboxylate transporter receptor subunit TctC
MIDARLVCIAMPGALAPTWPELGYQGVMENWRGVTGAKNITAEQAAFRENVFGRITAGDEYRNFAEQNQWDITFRGAAESRSFMAAQYDELKRRDDVSGIDEEAVIMRRASQ